MFSMELTCRRCEWRTVCGVADAISRLKLVGLLRREKDPSEELIAELLVDAAPRMTCPGCKERGLHARPTDQLAVGEDDDWDDWQAAVLCEICREAIPPERLEALPESKRCVSCQHQTETNTLPDDEPEFCPKCGSLVELRVSRGSGITRYKRFCTGSPACRLQ